MVNKDEQKSLHAKREEEILTFWKENKIFEKTLAKNEHSGKEFVFYEGPPTANALPALHHLEARAFKDVIPRYKTMRGFLVRRRGGWDTHGLPVELQVEKELGFKSKKDIEEYGIIAFNEKCKNNVWKNIQEWSAFTDRIGYWIDLHDPYVTYEPRYMESLWNIIKNVHSKGLLYKDYKIVPWCPRCGTALSSHELAQGYEDVKDISVYVKFKIEENTFFLVWTTTPWTLPANVALAVGRDIDYVKIKKQQEFLIIAKERLSVFKDEYEIVQIYKGSEFVGLSYEPMYQYTQDIVSEKENLANAYKVYDADFVTTKEGTGIVHIAVMYGQDDFELGTKNNLPKAHIVDETGHFVKGAGYLEGKFVKDEETAVSIIKDLSLRGLLFHKEKYEHSYPHCWRCKTSLVYYARDSWYIKMSKLKEKLIKENNKINWEPSYFKKGRFGEWLLEIKDWAISRERYWGTPLPVWVCEKCGRNNVVGSINEITQKPKNEYWVMRHGEATNNTSEVLNSYNSGKTNSTHHLTNKGCEQVEKSVNNILKIKPDIIFASPLLRTMETAEIVLRGLGLGKECLVVDERIREMDVGVWEGKSVRDFAKEFENFDDEERFVRAPEGGENYADIKKRMGDFLYDLENKYSGKKILIITHETPAFLLVASGHGWSREESIKNRKEGYFIKNAEVIVVDFVIAPHNREYEIDIHRPFVDEIKLSCECGGVMNRVKEVMDVWFDSGAMPFAKEHYPFENKEVIDGKGLFKKNKRYPADFICEAVDQTRGWFYTLHAVGILLGKGYAYRNVVCLGHILDSKGKKMSKSVGNVIDSRFVIDKFGVDALRYWMYSVNQPGEPKNFDEKTVDEVVKKVFNLLLNVLAFYKLYEHQNFSSNTGGTSSPNILDQWIVSRLNELTSAVTVSLDNYKFLEPTRAIRDFVSDLSTWYLRRSRERFKNEGNDKNMALVTTQYVLVELSKLLAPFAPFLAEHIYREVGGGKESVHLEDWSIAGQIDLNIIAEMKTARDIASKGLEARMKAGINVRQPLNMLKLNPLRRMADGGQKLKLKKEIIDIVKDEVNVKNIVFDEKISNEVELDLNITLKLKEEGDIRELIRKIQDIRKKMRLSVGDMAILVVDPSIKNLVSLHEEYIKKSASLKNIEYGETFELKV